MRFEWDERKATANVRKHGVTFETATEVFDDPYQLTFENYTIGDDRRIQIIGMTRSLVLVVVIFVDRSHANDEVIRIVSSRKATKYETELYRQQTPKG